MAGQLGGPFQLRRGEVFVGGDAGQPVVLPGPRAEMVAGDLDAHRLRRGRETDGVIEAPQVGPVHRVGVVGQPQGGHGVVLQGAVDPGFAAGGSPPSPTEQVGEGVMLEHVLHFVEQQQGIVMSRQQPLAEGESAQPPLAPDRIAVLIGVIHLVQVRAHRCGQHGGVFGLAHARRTVQQQVGARNLVIERRPQQPDRRRRIPLQVRKIRQRQGAPGRALEEASHQRLGVGVGREQDVRQILPHLKLVLQVGIARGDFDQSRGDEGAGGTQRRADVILGQAGQPRQQLVQKGRTRALRLLGDGVMKRAIPVQKHGEAEHGQLGFAQPEQPGEQIQVAHQRQVRVESDPRQFRTPLLEETKETLRRPGPSAPDLVLIRFIGLIVGCGQPGQGQEFVVIPTGMLAKRVRPTTAPPPAQQQGQVNQPAAQQRPIGGGVVVFQRQEGLGADLQKTRKSHEALQSGE